MSRPAPLEELPVRICEDLEYVFTDIDDTLTTRGLLLPESYSALWELRRAGIRVVPVTGRPAGWCDHIARMWPVDGVIGENGAFIFSYDRETRRMERVFLLPAEQIARGRERLARVRERVLAEIPGAAVAADQEFRLADLAIDVREDVEPLDDGEVQRICAIASAEGATCKVSSIHVNCWYGDYDKLRGVEQYLRARRDLTLDEIGETALFCGDSPNDEPLFAGLPLTVAVANIREFLDRLEHLPAYVTTARGGMGFAELVRAVLRNRAGRATSTESTSTK